MFAAGSSREEAEVREAIRTYLAELEREGKPAPAVRSVVGQVRV